MIIYSTPETGARKITSISALVFQDTAMNRERHYWLSFAAPDRFIGVIITPGETFDDALIATLVLGINPGGEVLGHILPEFEWEPVADRLLNRAQADRLAKFIDDYAP